MNISIVRHIEGRATPETQLDGLVNLEAALSFLTGDFFAVRLVPSQCSPTTLVGISYILNATDVVTVTADVSMINRLRAILVDCGLDPSSPKPRTGLTTVLCRRLCPDDAEMRLRLSLLPKHSLLAVVSLVTLDNVALQDAVALAEAEPVYDNLGRIAGWTEPVRVPSNSSGFYKDQQP